MKKNLWFVISLVLVLNFSVVKSQEGAAPAASAEKAVVFDPFACTMLIDNQTISSPAKGGKEFIIHHRMGRIKGIGDLFGLYAPANIRLGINYGVTDKLMLGFGTEKYHKMQEFMWKYAILQQQEGLGTPVFLSYYGNAVINGRDEVTFGKDYKFADRFSYFHQLIVARKFSDRISFEVAPSFIHFNKVDSALSNQLIGIASGGRVKIWNEITFMLEYNHPIPMETTVTEPKPNLSFGIEKSTGTHAFQLVASTANNIISQKNFLLNQNDFTKGEFVIGFNITVRL